jgi:HMW1C N-terminal/HMW1 domain 2
LQAPSVPLSLSRLERLVANGAHRDALDHLLDMLGTIDAANGGLAGLDLADLACDGSDEDFALVFCTRLASAIGRLLTDPGLAFGPLDYEYLLIQHRWIDTIFSLSGFRGSDPFIDQMATGTEADGSKTFAQGTQPRVLALLSCYAPRAGDIEALWRADPAAATLAFLHYLGARSVLRSEAAKLRERLLEWLPERLGPLRLGAASLARLPEIYMHCSYAFTPAKHAIKAPLIAELRRACLEAGAVEWQPATMLPPRDKPKIAPTVIVVAEHLRAGHSVFRTHSRAIEGLRARFHVVGVFREGLVDDAGAALFDETIRLPAGNLLPAIRDATVAIAGHAPALVFHIGVGMVSETIALASLRLAPVQCVSFGHTATTMSPAIDYMLLPEDFVGSDGVHSEEVVALPRAAMPYAPVAAKVPPRPPADGAEGGAGDGPTDGVLRIAVAASIPKLNPALFQALARIEAAATRPIEFHFLPLGAVGLACMDLARMARLRLKSAVVHPEAPHDAYMTRLGSCDFFLSPFPYGNMNGLLDAFQLGLPGVCLDGAEAHAHADAAIFARAGLPGALIARSIDDYVAQALRLIDDDAWLKHCRRVAADADLEAAFYTGDARLFADALQGLIDRGPAALREKAPSAMVRPGMDP